MTALDRAFVKAYLPQRHLGRRSAGTATEAIRTSAARQPEEGTTAPTAATVPQLQKKQREIQHDTNREPQQPIDATVVNEPTIALHIAPSVEPVMAEVVAEEPAIPAAESKPMLPLSAFTVTNNTEDEFRPSLEVDRFAWPDSVSRLLDRSEPEIESFAEQLAGRAYRGERVFSLVGMHREVGCTTAMLAIARQVSKRRLRTAVVDAKFSGPVLAARLGVAAASGWEQVSNGSLPIEEIIVASVEDGVSLVPLDASASASELSFGTLHVSVMFGVLRSFRRGAGGRRHDGRAWRLLPDDVLWLDCTTGWDLPGLRSTVSNRFDDCGSVSPIGGGAIRRVGLH